MAADLMRAARRLADQNPRHTAESIAEALALLFPQASEEDIYTAAEAVL